MNANYLERVEKLESNKQYDVDVNAGEYVAVAPVVSNQRYEYDRIVDKIYYALFRVFIFIVAPFMMFFTYRLKVKGRKNLRKVKGAVVISNHVALLDSLIIKQGVFRRIYYIGAEHNNKKGFGGYSLKVIGFLPLSAQFSNQKTLDKAVTKYLSKGKLIHVAPEQAMWRGYTKIRPFKNGAFHYATKNNVPIIPSVVLLKKPTKWDKFVGRDFRVVYQILPPVYPNNELSMKERIEDLKLRSRESIVKCANDFYNYETDVEK